MKPKKSFSFKLLSIIAVCSSFVNFLLLGSLGARDESLFFWFSVFLMALVATIIGD